MSPRPLLRILALILGLVLLLGAGRRHYRQALDSATRELVIYNHFSTALILRATYLSDDFRSDLATERHRLLDSTEEDRQAFVARMRQDGAVYHEVVFSAHSGMAEAEEFGSIDGWMVRLLADGREEELVTIYRVRRPNPLQRALYSHLNRWSELWMARFARTVAQPQRVELHVGSGYGNGTVSWEAAP